MRNSVELSVDNGAKAQQHATTAVDGRVVSRDYSVRGASLRHVASALVQPGFLKRNARQGLASRTGRTSLHSPR